MQRLAQPQHVLCHELNRDVFVSCAMRLAQTPVVEEHHLPRARQGHGQLHPVIHHGTHTIHHHQRRPLRMLGAQHSVSDPRTIGHPTQVGGHKQEGRRLGGG